VPERDAGDIAKLVDAGSLHDAYITKILTGGRSPIPVVHAEIFRADATAEGLVRQDQVPGPTRGSEAACRVRRESLSAPSPSGLVALHLF
jgi:hypothetical protein